MSAVAREAVDFNPGGREDTVWGALEALAERVQRSVVLVRGSRMGSGSGVILEEEGLILTNHHVVPRGDAEVVLFDGTRLAARVTARSPRLDLAALRLGERRSARLYPLPMGDSTRLRPGELVVAVGNPLGERGAVTMGVVSGTGGVSLVRGVSEVLQLSMTLRPGNSGGALVDASGKLVGIPHMVVSSGMALAVPSHVAARFLAGDRSERGRLGVRVQWVELPSHLVQRHQLPSPVGLLIVEVEPGSPAARAGLMMGDVLVGTRGEGGVLLPIDQLAYVRSLSLGQAAGLAVLRSGALFWREATPEP